MTSSGQQVTVRRQITVPLGLGAGDVVRAQVHSFDGLADGLEHVALAFGPSAPDRVPLVRLHSECLTGDVFGSQRCDCGPQLREALDRIAVAGGYLLYLRQEGRGIGLYNKLDAYALQDDGLDTYEANLALGFAGDDRDYTVGAQMLLALGVTRLDLLTNNPDKVGQLEAAGLEVARTVATRTHLSPVNGRYLRAKEQWAARLPGGGAWSAAR